MKRIINGKKYDTDKSEEIANYRNTGDMKCCKKPHINQLNTGKDSIKHLYCAKCKSHYWDGEFYTQEQWEEYVNIEVGEMRSQ